MNNSQEPEDALKNEQPLTEAEQQAFNECTAPQVWDNFLKKCVDDPTEKDS